MIGSTAEERLWITAIHSFRITTKLKLSLFSSRPQAGFPSPAEDYIEQRLDLNEYLIEHPAATFFVRVAGDSMLGAGIHDGDILIVDRALEAASNKIVIAVLDGEFTVKRLIKENGKIYLMPENRLFSPIEVKPGENWEIWGVVTHVIHPAR